jgi:hypothetical protein
LCSLRGREERGFASILWGCFKSEAPWLACLKRSTKRDTKRQIWDQPQPHSFSPFKSCQTRIRMAYPHSRNRSSYWPSTHPPFTKIRRTKCPTRRVRASSPASATTCLAKPLKHFPRLLEANAFQRVLYLDTYSHIYR